MIYQYHSHEGNIHQIIMKQNLELCSYFAWFYISMISCCCENLSFVGLNSKFLLINQNFAFLSTRLIRFLVIKGIFIKSMWNKLSTFEGILRYCTVLWKSLICGFTFQISARESKLFILIYSRHQYYSNRQNMHQITVKQTSLFLEFSYSQFIRKMGYFWLKNFFCWKIRHMAP